MSRRSHVVRTDDTAGIGQPRNLGGVTILCYTTDSGDVGVDAALVGPIPIGVAADYQRVFVSATVDDILVVEPE